MAKKKMSDIYAQMGSGGEIPKRGVVKEVVDKYHKRTLKDNAGHTILNYKEACMDAFNQATKTKNELLNQNGKKGIDISDLPDKIFRNM